MAENVIRHRGIVQEITEDTVKVKIIQTSACAACSVKGHCNASESKEKIIEVYDVLANSYLEGEEVQLCGTTSMGMLAVLLGFGVPFLVVMAVLVCALEATDGNEIFAALASLLGLIPYYLILYMYRDKLKNKFTFVIEPINN